MKNRYYLRSNDKSNMNINLPVYPPINNFINKKNSNNKKIYNIIPNDEQIKMIFSNDVTAKYRYMRREIYYKYENKNKSVNLYLYTVSDIENQLLFYDIKKYNLYIPDFPDPKYGDVYHLDKIKLLFNIQASDSIHKIKIHKIDGTSFKFEDHWLYKNLLLNKYDNIDKVLKLDIRYFSKRLIFYSNMDNLHILPPLKLFSLRDIVLNKVRYERDRFKLIIPDFVPDSDINNDYTFDSVDINLIKKISLIWKYDEFYKDSFINTKLNFTGTSVVIDENNKIKNYLTKYRKFEIDHYRKCYFFARNLIYKPNEIIKSKNISYQDLYNKLDDFDQYHIDKLIIRIKKKDYYYKNNYKINEFPDLSFYNLRDIRYGIFYYDKKKLNFQWPLIAPVIIQNDNNFIDFSRYTSENNDEWLNTIELFKYTKIEPNNPFDNKYRVYYIDKTSAVFEDNKGIINRWLDHLERIKNTKIKIYKEHTEDIIINTDNNKMFIDDKINNHNNNMIIDNDYNIIKNTISNNIINSNNKNSNTFLYNSNNNLDINLSNPSTNNTNYMIINNIQNNHIKNNNCNQIINNNNSNIYDNKHENNILNISYNSPKNSIVNNSNMNENNIVLSSRKYQIYIKNGNSFWDNKKNCVISYLTSWYFFAKKSFGRVSWSKYKLKNNQYMSYLCVILGNKGKTFAKYIPEDFILDNNISNLDNIRKIEQGIYHGDVEEFEFKEIKRV